MTLYNNFGSKDQLVKEYLNRTSEKFLADYREKIENADAEYYVIRDGIVVIPNDAVVPDGTII